MEHEAEVARREAVTGPLGPRIRYDHKCREWDGLFAMGEYPTDAAQRTPAQWQLVYELRPLELIPYWLGIPFKPHHPVYAVIYDPDAPGFYTAPAVKVAELGNPRFVQWAVPLTRLLDVSAQVDRALRALAEYARTGISTGVRAWSRLAEAISAAHRLRSGVRQ